MKNTLNKNFLFGAATAAYQVEGAWNQDGKGASNWDAFVKIPGKTFNNTNGDVAADHYNRYQEDVALMKEQGLQAYRFSIMWSRIYPDGFGEPNIKGINFYTNLIDELIKNNIEPLVTIHHWDMPLQVQGSGGFDTAFGREAFYKFSKLCFEKWGKKVDKWFIYNEMNINIIMGYIVGKSPPGIIHHHSRAINASYYTTLAIANVVKIYKELGLKGFVGVAHAYLLSHPLTNEKEDIQANKYFDEIFNDWFLDPLIKGTYKKNHLDVAKKYGLSPTKEELDIIKNNCINFLGVNYYNHSIIGRPLKETTISYNNTGDKKKPLLMALKGVFQQHPYGKDIETTDWGWGIYPKGLYESLKDIKEKYGDIPLLISENGIGLKESIDENNEINDDLRIKFIGDHLLEINRAKLEGVNVLGYCNWSFIDLLSWHNGYQKRYGYVYIDKGNNNKRIKKKSFYWMQKVIKTNGDLLFKNK